MLLSQLLNLFALKLEMTDGFSFKAQKAIQASWHPDTAG